MVRWSYTIWKQIHPNLKCFDIFILFVLSKNVLCQGIRWGKLRDLHMHVCRLKGLQRRGQWVCFPSREKESSARPAGKDDPYCRTWGKELLCYGEQGTGEAGWIWRPNQSFSEQMAGGIVLLRPCWSGCCLWERLKRKAKFKTSHDKRLMRHPDGECRETSWGTASAQRCQLEAEEKVVNNCCFERYLI